MWTRAFTLKRAPPELVLAKGQSVQCLPQSSGVGTYGMPTNFKYIVTNHVRDGQAREGFLRTEDMPSGNYALRIIAEDYAGNRASGKSAELPVTIRN